MARIETYQRDNLISDSDIVIGSDGDNLNITKNYTIGQLKTYFTEGLGGIEGGGVDTNFYLNGISTDENYLVTFSVVGAADPTLQLGSAAFAETTDFVSTDHSHVLADITDSGALAGLSLVNNDYIDKTNAGTVGQVLSLAADGQFTWVNSTSADSIGANELNIGGTPSDGDVITYNSGNLLWATRNFLALSDTPATFGATGALLKVNATADGLEFFTPNYAAGSHTHTLSEITDAGDLAALNLITTSELDTVNTGANGWVLALDSNLDLQWVTVSAASGIALTDLSVTQNSSGTAALTYNNSTGVFSYTPPDLSGYSLIGHTHSLADITDSGALAALNTITPAHITVTGTPTTDKVLGWSDANTFAWVDQAVGGGATYTEGDGIDISVSNVISVEDNLSIASLTTSGDVAVGNDLTVAGNFTVTGVTTTVNSTSLSVANRFIELNSGLTTANLNDSGLIIERGSLTNAVLLWDESSDRFIVGTGNITASTSDANTTYTFGDMQAATFHGALSGNASTASKWQTARTLSLTGDVTASLSVQGDADASGTTTIGNDKVTKSKLKGLSSVSASNGQVVVSDGSDGFNLVNQNTITGADKAFTDLTDTPSALTADNFVKVNSSGNALEYLSAVAESHLDIENDPVDGYVLEWDNTAGKMQWVPQSGGGVSNFTALTDTPSAYTGNDGKVAFVDESNNRLVFRHITFNDIYDAGGNDPIGYPPNDGQTYVLTGTTTGGTDDYEWVLESEIIDSGGGTVVITDPTADYIETGCANRSAYVARNPEESANLTSFNFTSIAYYNGYLYAIDRYGNRYKSTTLIEADDFNTGDLTQDASWDRINATKNTTASGFDAANLTLLPSGFFSTGNSFAFTSSGMEINYISISDFEDSSIDTVAAIGSEVTRDTKTGISTFGAGSRLYGQSVDKLIFFGGYLWAQHAYSISYKNSLNNTWSYLVHKTFGQGTLVYSNTSSTGWSYDVRAYANSTFADKRFSFAFNKYRFQGHHAVSGNVMLIACFNSVQQIKFVGGDWTITNIDNKIATLSNNINSKDTTAIVGLDYSDEGSGTWYVVVAEPTTGYGGTQTDQWADYWTEPKLYSYSESTKEDTRNMQNLDNNPFQFVKNLETQASFASYNYIMQAYPRDDFDNRVQFGTPGVVAVRAGHLYLLATVGFLNVNYQQTSFIYAYKYKISDGTGSQISINPSTYNGYFLNTYSYSTFALYPRAGVTPIKVADKLLLPIAVSNKNIAVVNDSFIVNGYGNAYLVTSC